jgi:multidrug transporter EmrE-like cation transporter
VTKGMDIGKGSILFGVASAVCGLFVGCIIFKESMQLLDYIGVVFGMVSIILLSLK